MEKKHCIYQWCQSLNPDKLVIHLVFKSSSVKKEESQYINYIMIIPISFILKTRTIIAQNIALSILTRYILWGI